MALRGPGPWVEQRGITIAKRESGSTKQDDFGRPSKVPIECLEDAQRIIHDGRANHSGGGPPRILRPV
jgi:hypothetical protein